MSHKFTILAVGDIHTHLPVILKVERHLDEFDKVVFLGDYVDDWDASPEASYNTIKKLIRLKEKYPDKIELLTGNHCLSEYLAGEFRCSGFKEITHQLVKNLYKTKDSGNVPLFQPAYSKGNILFTHAGITKTYWKDLQLLIKNHYPSCQEILNLPLTLAGKISNILGLAWLNHFSNRDDKLFQTFHQAGAYRGGFGTPSFVWADKEELLKDPLPKLHQVVGHSPVKTVEIMKQNTSTVCFCDTHSYAYISGFDLTVPIGDASFLKITLNKTPKYERIFLD